MEDNLHPLKGMSRICAGSPLGWLVGGRAVAISGSMIEATFQGGGTYADEALAVASVTKQQEVTITYPPGVRTTIPLTSIDDDMPVRDIIHLNRF